MLTLVSECNVRNVESPKYVELTNQGPYCKLRTAFFQLQLILHKCKA